MNAVLRCLLLVLLVLAPSSADACKCVPQPLGPAMKQAKHVFLGRIVEEIKTKVDTKTCRNHPDWCVYTFAYKVEVEGHWKGDITTTLTIDTGTNRGDCSMGRLRGHKYIFFASGDATQPRIHMCGGTRVASDSALRQMTKLFGAPEV